MDDSYLSLLDEASLFQFLLRLHYEDLINVCKTYTDLYKISVTSYFQESWKKYNIRLEITSDWNWNYDSTHSEAPVEIHAETDRNNLWHGKVVTYDGMTGHKLEESSCIQDQDEGITTIYKPDSTIKEIQTFVAGRQQGLTTVYSQYGSYIEYNSYNDGRQSGLTRIYFRSGAITWREYHMGKQEGLCILWYGFEEGGGRHKMVRYHNGEPYGIYVKWDRFGNIVKKCRVTSKGKYIPINSPDDLDNAMYQLNYRTSDSDTPIVGYNLRIM